MYLLGYGSFLVQCGLYRLHITVYVSDHTKHGKRIKGTLDYIQDKY